MRFLILVACALFVLAASQYNRTSQTEGGHSLSPAQHVANENTAQTVVKEQTSLPPKKQTTGIAREPDQVPDINDAKNSILNIGDFIDVDAIQPDYGREPVNIGDYVDVDAVPIDDGRPSINMGEYMGDPDDPSYFNQQYQEPLNIGEYLPPPGEYDPSALGEYTEPLIIGEPIDVD